MEKRDGEVERTGGWEEEYQGAMMTGKKMEKRKEKRIGDEKGVSRSKELVEEDNGELRFINLFFQKH